MKFKDKILIGCLILASTSPTYATEATFSDVPPDHSNYPVIEYLHREEIFNGYDDGTFQLNKEINRAELMTIMAREKNLELDANLYNNCFPDVTNQWFAASVCYAKEQGWINGYESGLFGPADSVTEQQALKIILNPLFKEAIENQTEEELIQYNKFYVTVDNIQIDPSKWYAPYTAFANAKNILDLGSSTNAMTLSNNISREKTATFLMKAKLVAENGWTKYSQLLRDVEFSKKDINIFTQNRPVCHRINENEAVTFINKYLSANYGENVEVQSYEGEICLETNGDLLFSIAVPDKEDETISTNHLIRFNQAGEVKQEDFIECGEGEGHYYLMNEYLADGEGAQEYDFGTHERQNFVLLSCDHLRSDDRIYFNSHNIDNVDANSFEVLGDWYSKDKNHVYYQNRKTDEIDVDSFKRLNENYSMDKNSAYYVDFQNSWHPIKEADPTTFKVLNDKYAQDKNHTYVWYHIIFPEPDQASFEVFDYHIARDKDNVYIFDTIPENIDVDMESFEYLDGRFYKDEKNIYYGNRGVIEGTDLDSFEILYDEEYDFPTDFSKDKDHLYYNNERIKSHPLDQDTVEPSSGVSLIDANGDECDIERDQNDALICTAI